MRDDQRQAQLTDLQLTIRSCRRCVAAGYIPIAQPILRGAAAARIMVVGQAPGATGAERPVPYSGATGKTLAGWLARAGFTGDALYDPQRFYLTSLTKCFPGKASSGCNAGDRAPSRAEIGLCASHLAAELALVQPELILALGRLSIDALLPAWRGLPLAELVGTARPAGLRAAGAAQVLALPHPSGVSRWHNDATNQTRLALALDWLNAERAQRGW